MENQDTVSAARPWWRTSSPARTRTLWLLALATIVIGFADLARGGVTIAPVLLVLGYCVLVPLAILS